MEWRTVGLSELEKQAMKLEREFERAPSFSKQKVLNDLWDKIHQQFLMERKENK